jgi:methionyl-tRNA formyltransferase
VRLVFLGTSEFAGPALIALLGEHAIELVVTRPDRPAGRHAELLPSPIKRIALEHGVPLLQPDNINDPEPVAILRDTAADAIVVASYGQLLKSVVFNLARHGTINIHASLLPAYRGAAPVNWAIIQGERKTGISTFFIEKGMDTGDVLMQASLDIGADETAAELENRLAELGGRLILDTLEGLERGSLQAVPQPAYGASLAPSLTRGHGRIDWHQSAARIHNLVRGTVPWPGAWTQLGSSRIKIHRTRRTTLSAGVVAPGEIGPPESNRLLVGTEDEFLEILLIQREGKSPVSGRDFLRGLRMPASFT